MDNEAVIAAQNRAVPPLVSVRGLSKAYGGVQALSGVDLEIAPGEVHALVGENGAGKSTLIKILTGSVLPDAGMIAVGDRTLPPGSPTAASEAGIAALHQESTAFPHLGAIDNIFVGAEPRRFAGLSLDRPRMIRETRALLERLGESIDIHRPIGELPLAQRQMVGIARALSRRGRLLILDEPTASLSARETDTLLAILRQLRADGMSVLYVSHRLEEIFALADRITVLRDGRKVETLAVGDVDRPGLIRRMVGREIAEGVGEDATPVPEDAGVVLEVGGLTREGAFAGIDLKVRTGEIVGLAGLVGAGRSEVARAIFGIEGYGGGAVTVAGTRLRPGSVEQARRSGVALVPEDRQREGLIPEFSVGDNLTLAVLSTLSKGGVLRPERERETAARLVSDLGIRTAGLDNPVSTLSGGNQQKVVVGKWLAAAPRVLILDEPTRGVDVGAKAEIYRLIRELAARGMAVLVISSDLPEILTLSDRIYVMRSGKISAELARAEATQERILHHALPPSPGETPATREGAATREGDSQ